jgi:hypothetical protein
VLRYQDIPPLRRYGVQRSSRQPLVAFMVDALRANGCRIIYASDPSEAPFVITFESNTGERIGIVAYAFLATRTPTKNRPKDERSFQIKYGPEDKALHELWQDPLGLYTTLLVGIDPDEGFFVAADPEVHNPTRFFIRLEFKDSHVTAIKRSGWHAWERQSRGPRHLLISERTFEFETLVGGVRENFLKLVRFERAAVGLAPGDRQLLAEKWDKHGGQAGVTSSASELSEPDRAVHPLAAELELSAEQILELIATARRLKMAVRGWVAEEKLREALTGTPGVTHCERLDEEGGPDLRVRWKGGRLLSVECKNVLRKLNTAGLPRIDFQRTRASKHDPCSRYYAPTDFDLVAACLHAVSERWEFRYMLPQLLPPRAGCPGKLDNRVTVDGRWVSDATAVFEAAYARSGSAP